MLQRKPSPSLSEVPVLWMRSALRSLDVPLGGGVVAHQSGTVTVANVAAYRSCR